ncbi:MAG: hypothetical protein JW915_19655 [Chitinispirillaceae bacterium]|nr:hypothetical protein [Chitinispirillaceae bacterium]
MNNQNSSSNNNDKSTLAYCIVGGGMFYILLLLTFTAIPVFCNRETDSDNEYLKNWKGVIDITLPLLGAWVGAVVAYYYSNKNFEAASRQAQNLLSIEDKLKIVTAQKVMIKRRDIRVKEIEDDSPKSLDNIKIVDLVNFLKDINVTRVPIFLKNNRVKYVIHKSLLYEALYDYQTKNIDTITFSLSNFLDDKRYNQLIKAIAFVKESDSLADTKNKMKKIPNCQDVFVTETGDETGDVIGWITNAELAKEFGLTS